MRVTVVTISYSKRWDLLRKTLQAALEQGAERAIVVDNEADEEIAPRAADAFGDRVRTLRLEKNRGSAGAYDVGLRAAMADGAEFLLMLDDDNCLATGSLAMLLDVYGRLAPDRPRNNLCLLGFRPSHQPEVFQGVTPDPLGNSNDSFLGFHVKDLHRKILTRLTVRKRSPPQQAEDPLDRLYRLTIGPFGGMLFHRSVIERYGYPDASFVLYLDDTEFTYRITSTGGEVVLVPRARIEDIDQSWNTSAEARSTFDRWLLRGSNKQVFYTARNWSFFQTHRRSHSWMLKVNKLVYMFILWVLSKRWNKTERFQLMKRAIRDGEQSLMGINPAFPPAK